ncbi:MAG: hypothetical protein R3321_11985 [Nitrososphaeraceae archaeon]|nr:hypothetical protein [Nitrososphaeraceae archaeon]
MKKVNILLILIFLCFSFISFSQGPGGGRPGGRPGGGPEEMIKREQQALYNNLEDLSNDQKMLLDGIYKEFQTTLEEAMKEMRASGDREGRREKMLALRKEKDALIKDVLSEDQYLIYEDLSKLRGRRGEKSDGKPEPEEGKTGDDQ